MVGLDYAQDFTIELELLARGLDLWNPGNLGGIYMKKAVVSLILAFAVVASMVSAVTLWSRYGNGVNQQPYYVRDGVFTPMRDNSLASADNELRMNTADVEEAGQGYYYGSTNRMPGFAGRHSYFVNRMNQFLYKRGLSIYNRYFKSKPTLYTNAHASMIGDQTSDVNYQTMENGLSATSDTNNRESEVGRGMRHSMVASEPTSSAEAATSS